MVKNCVRITYGEVKILVQKLTIYFYRLKLAAEINRLSVSICWLFRKSSERADAHFTNWFQVVNNAMLNYSYHTLILQTRQPGSVLKILGTPQSEIHI